MAEMKVQELAEKIGKTESEVVEMLEKKGIAADKDTLLNEEQVELVKSTAKKKKKIAVVVRSQNSTKPINSGSGRRSSGSQEKKPASPKSGTRSQNGQGKAKTEKPADTAAKKKEEAVTAPVQEMKPAAEKKPARTKKAEGKPEENTVSVQAEVQTSVQPEAVQEKVAVKPESTGDAAQKGKAGEQSQAAEQPVKEVQTQTAVQPKEEVKAEQPAPEAPKEKTPEEIEAEKAAARAEAERRAIERAKAIQAAAAKVAAEKRAANGGSSDRPRRNNDRPRRDGQGAAGRRDGDRPRRDGQGAPSDRPRRDGQGGAGRRDGQGFQSRDNDNRSGGFNRRDNQGGYNKDGYNKDNYTQDRPQSSKRRDDRKTSGGMDGMAPAMSKNDARGGKGLNKKERELREKSRQNEEKNGKRQENIKSFDKMKNAGKNKQAVQVQQEDDGIKTLTLPETMTLKELADMMKQPAAAIIKKLFLQGNVLNINSELTYEQAEEIALDYNFICEKEVKVDVLEELLRDIEDPEDSLVPRPPVVCVMGHVDHGKTSLLDKIRSSNVTAREAGGITQHIGAYMVKCRGENITFLDTPGHEAFTAMRMRGAQSTDIAILVVAADDGVMPQTVEAINHAKAAGVEIVVAINKIDKPSANIDRVMQELSEYELIPEDWGGSTIFVPVSAHTGEGIDTLLEMILLVAEMKELRANPDRKARGLVIEAQLDKGRGPVATVLVQKGILRVGDNITAGCSYGKVRAMIDDKGRRVKEASPSTPVEILGLNEVPNAGDTVIATASDKEARNIAETFISEGREKLIEETKSKLTLDGLFSQIKAGNLKELNIIIKADVQGSVEAVKQSLVKLSNEEVVVKVIHGGVGAINESDVILASASNAIIIGFNVRPDVMAKAVAEREKVDLRLYRVIYQAIEDVEAAMKGMLDPIFEEKIIGHGIVRATFKASGIGVIAGTYVTDGILQRGCSIRLKRDGEVIFDGPMASLKHLKDDVKEMKEGFECGVVLEKFNDIKEDDILEAYKMVEVPR